MKRLLTALISAGLTVCVGLLVANRFRDSRRLFRRVWPVNLAHRGASARAPENTLEAFEIGLKSGAGGLETDAHLTLDHEVVVIHDENVDRTTDGSGFVREMTLRELRSLDAGHGFSPDGESFPYRGQGLEIPTLREVYEKFPEAVVNVELKEDQGGLQEKVLEIIEEFGAEDRTLVASFGDSIIRRFRSLQRVRRLRKVSGGRMRTGASRWEISVFYALSKVFLEGLVPVGYDALQVPVEHRGRRIVTPRFIEAAHSRGVSVDVWTINDPAEMRRLLDFGVDVIMTDRPEELSRVIREQDPGSRPLSR